VTHRHLIWFAATWQFIYMVDFVLPLPLGPALSRDLGFAAPAVAWLSVSYTVASLLAGLGASLVVDRLGKRTVIVGGLACFVLANAATAVVDHLAGLLLCRALAALAGAPVVATLMSEVIDQTPADQRGRSISVVMSGASIAVILGVPMALGVSEVMGWRAAFSIIAALSAMLLSIAWRADFDVEKLEADKVSAAREGTARTALSQLMILPTVQRAMLLQALSQFATFLIIPVLATYLVINLRISSSIIPLVYSSGGLVAFACMRFSGGMSDRMGYRTPFLTACAALMLAMTMFGWGVSADQPLMAVFAFILFMAANAAKNVALASHTAGAPPPGLRASFMNVQCSMQDAAILVGSLGPLALLSQSSQDAAIEGMPTLMVVALVAMLALIVVDAFRPGSDAAQDQDKPA